MPINKESIAITLSIAAVTIASYGAFFTTAPSTSHLQSQNMHDSRSSNEIDRSDAPVSNNPLLKDLQTQVTALKLELTNLKLSNIGPNENVSSPDIKELVLAVIEEKEQKEIEELRDKNPLYGFYADLPDDYDLRIKSDPAFTKSVNEELRSKILSTHYTDLERLGALSQLQMNMFILNKSQMPEYDYEAVGSILDLATVSNDEKFKIQAIEITTQAPVSDYRLVERFSTILKQDNNDYVRTLASQGLINQYYQAKGTKNGDIQQVAEQILSLYQNTSDEKVKSLLHEMVGDEVMLEELRKHSQG
ncbi:MULTISPECIES: hypothetical protein [Pseudoalteromonas]|jgi:hypothetical protein|uniref:HEAT repeat domain-containing protein n=1 Tax=Pseudoalteromonas aliena SW19 TaxID=1314866 RepID=A0ABR9E4W6_9GAMM|nr:MULTISPECIES: hypothetical protein [Pseudoalteromonas]MBE0360955.1 hypothetical protein [Pseudoalteromonas aliena SW19]